MRILAAHPSESFLALLKKHLEPAYQVRCCGDGQSAMEELDSFRPDALLLHMCLPVKDGLTLLEQTPYTPPIVIAITDWQDSYLARKLQALGVAGLLLMPTVHTAAAMLDRRLQDARSIQPIQPFPQMLRSLGFYPAKMGYQQLCLAAELLEQDMNQPFYTQLYPAIARTLNLSDGRCVEKAIRTSIQTAWKEGEPLLWRRYFPNGKCPSNRVFLLGMLELYRNGPGQNHTRLCNGTFHG